MTVGLELGSLSLCNECEGPNLVVCGGSRRVPVSAPLGPKIAQHRLKLTKRHDRITSLILRD